MSLAQTFVIELAARVPHRAFAMAGPRAAARAGEIRTGHGGIKSRETSVARIGTVRVGANSRVLPDMELAMTCLKRRPAAPAAELPQLHKSPSLLPIPGFIKGGR